MFVCAGPDEQVAELIGMAMLHVTDTDTTDTEGIRLGSATMKRAGKAIKKIPHKLHLTFKGGKLSSPSKHQARKFNDAIAAIQRVKPGEKIAPEAILAARLAGIQNPKQLLNNPEQKQKIIEFLKKERGELRKVGRDTDKDMKRLLVGTGLLPPAATFVGGGIVARHYYKKSKRDDDKRAAKTTTPKE